jgi:ubiquinone/menaquinone biosynthesis C-methylase UbiE
MHILDIGCGPGTITIGLARLVPDGRVTALDYTSSPVEQTRSLAANNSITNMDFAVGDIHHLDFADNSFDVVHTHQVLQHIADPVLALREMHRIVKPGGMVACRETVSMSWYPELPGLARFWDVWRRVSDSMGGNPHPGARLHVWAREAGFESEKITKTAGSWCYSTKEERESWGGSYVERATGSGLADNAVKGGICTREELGEMAEAWREWVMCEDGWFAVWHGEILCVKD